MGETHEVVIMREISPFVVFQLFQFENWVFQFPVLGLYYNFHCSTKSLLKCIFIIRYILLKKLFFFFFQIFIEFCDGGALDSIIVELEKGLTEKQIAYVCHGMCRGLVHLHKQGIIHRDLKAGNVLLTCEVKIKKKFIFILCLGEETIK